MKLKTKAKREETEKNYWIYWNLLLYVVCETVLYDRKQLFVQIVNRILRQIKSLSKL